MISGNQELLGRRQLVGSGRLVSANPGSTGWFQMSGKLPAIPGLCLGGDPRAAPGLPGFRVWAVPSLFLIIIQTIPGVC